MINQDAAHMHLDFSGGRTAMDKISESLLNEFSSEHAIVSLQEDKRFEHFASFIVIKRHYPSTFDTADVVVGEGGDTGIDGIAIIVNGSMITDIDELENSGSLDVSFIFVQAKTRPSFDSSVIGDFGHGVVDFFRDTPTLKRNQKISDMAAIQADLYTKRSSKFVHNPSLRLYYVTTGKWVGDKDLESRRQAVIDDLQRTNLFRSVEFRPIDAEALQELYRQAKNAISNTFKFEKNIPLPQIPGITAAYLGFMPAQDFIGLVQADDGEFLNSVFYDNPRDWQDYNPVNSEIKQTIESGNSNRFVVMNNGITIIARKVQASGEIFTIQDYQIVNGCQTSHVLHDQRDKLTANTLVPVRLIGTDNEDVINDIIHATNRQTEIKPDQFFASQEFPKQLETYFQAYPQERRIYYERRSRQYDRLPVEKTRVITHPNMIRAFAAMFLNEPHRTTRNYAMLTKRIGKEIFVKGHKYEPYYLAAFALNKLESMFRSHRIEAYYKPARFHILMALRMLGGEKDMPLHMNSQAMATYCNEIMGTLWDNEKADKLISQAIEVITTVANGNFERDNIRTDEFTEMVIAECSRLRVEKKKHKFP